MAVTPPLPSSPSSQAPPLPGVRERGIPATAAARRGRYAMQTAVLLLAVTAACLFAGLIASRNAIRFDATATREHRLSPRTLELLGRLTAPHEIVVAANLRSLDPASRERARDVLDAFTAASAHLRASLIDTGSASGLADYDALLARLIAPNRAVIQEHTDRITDAADRANELSDFMEELSTALLELRDATAGGMGTAAGLGRQLDGTAAEARISAGKLTEAAAGARRALAEHINGVPLPPTDVAARALLPQLNAAAVGASNLREAMQALTYGDVLDPAARDRARVIADTLAGARDRAARAVASLETLPPLAVLAIARALEGSQAALVIGPPRRQGTGDATGASIASVGVTAIDFDSLFPPSLRTHGADAAPSLPSIDTRFRAEELIATALASLNNPAAPIVVFVHGAPESLAPEFAPFSSLVERLRLRGMDVVDWPAAEGGAPSIAGLDPERRRPVVYATISTNAMTVEGAARMAKLAAAISGLADARKPILLSVTTSTLPSIGEPDPMVAFLDRFGLAVDSAKPLLRELRGPAGRVVTEVHDIVPAGGVHPLARAVEGLRLRFLWPMPVRPSADAPEGADAPATLLEISGAEVWGESEWVDFKHVPPQQRVLLPRPPAPDSTRDLRNGPWTVAAAAERRSPDRTGTQRLVVVGSNAWFFDDITDQVGGIVDGRAVAQSPGNIELFEAAVYWLAGQGELIARSATAEAVPRIRPLTEGQIAAVRWSLIAGLPALVLLIGAAWRLLRG